MKIRIIKCSDKNAWYYSLIGKELKANQKMSGCMAQYTVRNEYRNETTTGLVYPGDYEVIK